MTLDPAAVALMADVKESGAPALDDLPPLEAREAAKGLAALGGPPEDVASVENRLIPGPGGELPVRIYTPTGSVDGPLPCLVYSHGGGWVMGDLESIDSLCRVLANRAGCVIVSVDYRLAPEHQFPAPIDDCLAALRWVAAEGSEIGVDTERLAIGGDSGGATLAAAVAIRARDEGGPELRMQLLVYPVADIGTDTASYAEHGDGLLFTSKMMQWCWDHYLPEQADGEHPWASPLRADLSNLPPALVITAEYDILRDDGQALADKLAAAGVPVTHKCYPGQIHGFWQMLLLFESAYAAVDQAAEALRESFGTPVG